MYYIFHKNHDNNDYSSISEESTIERVRGIVIQEWKLYSTGYLKNATYHNQCTDRNHWKIIKGEEVTILPVSNIDYDIIYMGK